MSDYLCEELIIEIFTRLPSKSLLRFRSLSKSLCSCIASPVLIRRHTSRSPQKVLITHFVDNIREYGNKRNGYFYTLHSDDQLPLCPKRGYIGIPVVELPCNSLSVIIGSCNGIVCLLGYRSKNRISLWNPSIKRELTLPDCRVSCSPSCFMNTCGCGVHRFRIGLDIYATGLGFGFDPITDDYKIVCLPISGGNGASSLIYKMKTGAWYAITSPTPSFYKVTSRGCFTNGALHWMVKCFDFTGLVGVGGVYILTFNLSTHVFGKIVLPYYSWAINQYLTTFQGSLSVISTKEDDIWIWVMGDYDNTASWSVVSKSKTTRFEQPLGRVWRLTNNGDFLFVTYKSRFGVYDSKKGARSRLLNLTVYDSYISDMEMFVESLQLLDMGTPCRGR